MTQNHLVAEVLETIRTHLPASFSYRAGERDELTKTAIEKLKDAPDEVAVEFILASLRMMHDEQTALAYALENAVSNLLRRKLSATPAQVLEMIELCSIPQRVLPHKGVLKMVESAPVTPPIADALRRMRPCITEYHGGAEMRNLHARIDTLLEGPAPATSLTVEGAWSQIVFAEIAASKQKNLWEQIFLHGMEGKGSQPSRKWLATASRLVDLLGTGVFLESVARWLALGPSPQRSGVQLNSSETELQKGFLWFLAAHDHVKADPRLPALLAGFAEGALKKIPSLGAVSQKVGNACVNVLAELPGLASVSQLSGLAQRVRYDTAQRLIEEALTRAALRAGVSREQLEEMSISDYGLGPEGSFTRRFGDDLVTLSVADTTTVVTQWSDAQGMALKSVPARIKEGHALEWKELQRTAKEMEKTLSAQRSRIETLLLTQRSIPIDILLTCYLNHPLLADMARRLIWQFDTGAGIWFQGRVVDSAEREMDLSRQTAARLWHPIHADVHTVLHWRCWLEDHGIRQPFKQAHREVYLITEAERETGVYSNRFAAHILRQHVFAALCEERDWTFRLMGQWDSHNTPTLELPAFGLRVRYEVAFPMDENEVSGHFIYLLIRTGRITFLDRQNIPQRLQSIPSAVFAEVMRDVDLFTGVASIGCDPAWGLREPVPFRSYWDGFSFGELSEMAANRRSILERLLPLLAIKDRCKLEPRFLKVRGDRTEYRIHLGSGNILMEPGSRYLCILEGGATKSMPRDLALPFEGDRVLSQILSKAFLLAADRYIKEEKILRQLPPLPA